MRHGVYPAYSSYSKLIRGMAPVPEPKFQITSQELAASSSGRSKRQASRYPAEAAPGNTAPEMNSIPTIVGGVDHVVSNMVNDAGPDEARSCPLVLVVATGVLLGRMSPIEDATAVVKKNDSFTSLIGLAPVWIVA